MGKNRKKAQIKQTIRLGNKSITVLTELFTGKHTDYSGFGYHMSDKERAESRRDNKSEERNARQGYYD